MKCPNCGLKNSEIAESCDCGHHFSKDELKKPMANTDDPSSQESREIVAKICLHLAAGIFFLCGILFFVFFKKTMGEPDFFIICFAMILFAVLNELAVYGLNKKRYWGRVLSVGLFVIYIPTPFMLLGLIGLWALLAKKARLEWIT